MTNPLIPIHEPQTKSVVNYRIRTVLEQSRGLYFSNKMPEIDPRDFYINVLVDIMKEGMIPIHAVNFISVNSKMAFVKLSTL